MFKIFTKVLATAAMLFLTTGAYAQMSGTYTVDGVGGTSTTFATLAAAVTQLNTGGISGTTTIVMGVSETAPVGGYVISATGTASASIIFSGAGNTITAPVISTVKNNDAFFKINGGDYITIDNFVMVENAANTNATAATNTMTEFGIVMGRFSSTNGAQYNTISNNTITLRGSTTYVNTVGIYVTGRHDVSATDYTVAGTATATGGDNSYNTIRNNTISGVTQGVQWLGNNTFNDVGNSVGNNAGTGNTITVGPNTGNMTYTFSGSPTSVQGIAAAGNSNFTASYNTISTSGTTTSVAQDGVYFTSSQAVAGSSVTTNNNTITLNQTAASATTNAVYGIRNIAGQATGSFTATNNTVTLTAGTNGNGSLNWIYNTGTYGSININSNQLKSNGIVGTGTCYMIYNSQSGINLNIQNNQTVGNITRTSTSGTFYGIYGSGTPTGIENVTGNNFSNLNMSTLTSGTFYGLYNIDGTVANKQINNNTLNNINVGGATFNGLYSYLNASSQLQSNTVSNITSGGSITCINITSSSIGGSITNNTINAITMSAASGTLYGISAYVATNPSNISNNTINNLTASGASSPTIRGIYLSGGFNTTVSQNTVSNLNSTAAAASATIAGITVAGPTTTSVSANKIYNLSAAGPGGSVRGINVSSGTTATLQNNIVGDLTDGIATGANAIAGIEITGGTTIGVTNNTVRLAGSGGATFGSSAFYVSTNTPAVTSINNIFINNSTPGATSGYTAAFRYGVAPTTAGYKNSSNNNLYYAGTPATNSLIYGEGATAAATNGQQTLAVFQMYIATRDASSVTENTAFTSTTGANAGYLHVAPATPSVAESGGATGTGVGTDYDGDIRASYSGYTGSGSSPDIGADEFSGTNPNACSGTPFTAAITSSISTACASASFTINITNSPLTPGLSYQLQSSPSGMNTFTNVGTPQNALVYNLSGQSASMDYRVVVTCSNGGLTSNSNTVTVSQNSFLSCYCTPTNGVCTSEFIKTVTVNTLSNNSNVCTAGGYADYTASPSLTTTLNQGASYSLSVLARINSTPAQAGVWIDYNQNGVFETSEFTLLGTGPTTGYTALDYTFTNFVTIPLSALTGQTRMRVRSNNAALASNNSCPSTTWYGETEDYLITIGAAQPCSGQPTTPVIASSVSSACAGTGFSLSASGYSTAGISGFTFQFQSSVSGANNFSNIGTVQTVPTYTVAAGISANTDYRVIATCTNGNLTSTSNIITVSSAYINCYCIPTTTNGCTGGDHITNTAGFGINNASGVCLTASYSDYKTTVAAGNATQSSTYTITVNVNNGGTEYAGAWIDFDHSGTFDASEYVTLTDADGVAPWIYVGNVTIPAGAALGNTGFRVRSSYSSTIAANSACGTYSYGETEDYVVNIVQNLACTGTPPNSTATSSITSACTSGAFTLNITGIPPTTTGLTYQWQSSPAGNNTFTNIAGATTVPYTVSGQPAATDYRVIVTCTSSTLSTTSSIVSVAQSNFISCYCAPTSTYGCTSYGTINTVSFAGLYHTPGCSASPYYTIVPVNTATASVTPSNTFTLTVNSGPYDIAAAWIDWDQDGVFNSTTEYYVLGTTNSTNGATNKSATVTVPAGAAIGNTKMRIRSEYYGYTLPGTAACTTSSYGESVDYTISVNQAIPCNGNPPNVNATASVTSSCPANPFTLSASGIPAGTTGLTYQWQYSVAGSPFANLTGATTNPYYNALTQGGPTDYQLIVTCTNGGGTVTSNPVTVQELNYAGCYCTPSGNTPTYYINNFATTGGTTNITNNASGYSPNGYGNFSATMSASAVQNSTVNFSAAFTGGTFGFAIFIDYNHNGSFADAGETVYVSNTYSASYTGSFTVPVTALSGNTRMRIVAHELNTAPSAFYCGTNIPGEFEDYTFNVIPTNGCTGTPTTPVVTSTAPNGVCSGGSFSLGSSNLATTSGNTYQWQSSAAGANSFSNIAGATTIPYSVTGFTTATDYRLVVTCANSGLTATSATLSETINFFNCYCTTNLGGGGIPSIDNTTIVGTSLNNSTPGYAPSYYTVYPASGNTTATLSPGGTYTLTNLFVGGAAIASFWIDYDHSGTYDASEWTQIATNSPAGATTSVNFTVPLTALSGQTGFRVRSRSSGNINGAVDACTTFGSGETEDYVITIAVPIPCAGTPPATTATSSVTVTCGGQPFILNVTGIPIGTSGLTYQWQSRPAGIGSFANIAGATTLPYTVNSQVSATDYQVIVTCTASGLSSTSSIVSVGQNNFTSCYCTPSSTCTNEGITNVTINTLNNTSAFCAAAGGYSDYTAVGGAATTSLSQGATYNINVTATINSNPGTGGVWIDYDHSGSFDASEFTAFANNTAYTTTAFTGTFTQAVSIPAGAVLGTTRMRVRYNNSAGLTATQACATGLNGETEDYLITITAPVLCSGTPSPGTASSTLTAVCAANSFTLSTSGFTSGVSGITFQWQSRPSGVGTFTNIAGATNATYTVTGQTASTDYRILVTCTNSSLSATSNTVSVIQNALSACYCTPGSTSTTFYIDNFSTTGGTTNISNLTSGYSTGGYGQFLSQTVSTTPGGSFNFATSFGSSPSYDFGVAIWIDFNQNGSFADPGELVYNTTSYVITTSGTINIPTTALSGTTRMRVEANYLNTNPSTEYCSTIGDGEFEDYTVVIGAPPACVAPSGITATNITTTGATISFTASSSAPPSYDVYYGLSPLTAPTAGTTPTASTTTTSLVVSGLAPSSTYTYYVRSACGGSSGTSAWSGPYTLQTLLGNDDATGATLLTVGAGCTGAPYDNTTATQSTNEPYSSCRGTAGYHTTWYKFVAPTSGSVRVSTDAGSGNTLTDSRLSVFSATNVNNYATFTNLACDDDGGSSVGGALSVAYVTGLTGGQTYYIQVDGYSAGSVGTYCLTVDELNSSMIAAGGSCVSGQSTYTTGPGTFTGFVSILDNSSNLIALVKVPAGMPASGPSFTPSLSTNTGTVRSDLFNGANQKYLDRNYLITSTVTGATVQFFFLNSELTALQTADPASTLAKINVTEQSGSTCQASYAAANGTNTLRFQTGSGTANGAGWVQASGIGFSNFYLHRSSAVVNAIVGLQGDMQGSGIMRTDLQDYLVNNSVALLPTTDPYGLGATYASINNNTGIAGAVVDWVDLEVRNATSIATLATPVQSKALLLKPNGTMVDPTTGAAAIIDAQSYPVRLVVKHRNHMAVMSNDIAAFYDAVTYNFTTSLSQASNPYGDPVQEILVGGKWCMWAGDVNQDLVTDITDRNIVNSRNLAGDFDMYQREDVNLDGVVDITDLNITNSANLQGIYSTLLNY